LFTIVEANGKEIKYHLSPEGRRFGTVYETYQKKVYWWEPVALMRRTALIAVSISTTEPIYLAQGYMFVTVAILMLQVWFKPFCLKIDNQLEKISLLFLTLIAILQTSVINKTNYTVATEVFMTLFILAPIIGILGYLIRLQYHAFKSPKTKEASKDVELTSPTMKSPQPMPEALPEELQFDEKGNDLPPGLEAAEDDRQGTDGEVQPPIQPGQAAPSRPPRNELEMPRLTSEIMDQTIEGGEPEFEDSEEESAP